MHEQFLNGITLILNDYIDNQNLERIKNKIASYTNDYSIDRLSTEISIREEIPMELSMYLVSRKIEGMADSSLTQYNMHLREFFRYIRKPVADIGANDIRTYLFKVQEDRGISNRTLNNRRRIVHSFFEWLCNENYIDKNPCRAVRPITYPQELRQPLDGIEMEMLREACETLRDRAMIEFFYSTGCRVSEMVHLDVGDVDFQKKEVLLFGKRSKYRISYINPKCEVTLKEYLKQRPEPTDGSLFSTLRRPYKRIGKRGIEDRISYLGAKAGIERSVFPHLIRHTIATDELRRGMDITEVQRFLGHENINTTLIYAHVNDDNVRNGYMKYMG